MRSLLPRCRGVRLPLLTCLLLWCLGPFLQGCDVVFVVLAAEGKFSKKKSDDNSSTAPAPPDVSYAVYVGNFATPSDASTEQGVLDSDANGGNPSASTWQFLGRRSATSSWTTIPGGMNAVLIQGPLTRLYNIDAFERLDANGAVVEVPSAAGIYNNRTITSPSNASGMLDGVASATVISDPAHIPCIFARFTQPISAMRIRIWGPNQTSGDCVWTNAHSLANADAFQVGGAAANGTGTIYTTYVDTTLGQSFLLSFAPDGTKNAPVNIALNASSAGGISSAVDSSSNVFVASALSTGQIAIQKFASGVSPFQWSTVYIGNSGSGTNVIRPNGLAVANNVPLLSSPGTNGTAVFLAGGQGPSGLHTLVRFDDTPSAGTFTSSLVWGPKILGDPSSNSTGWSAVSTAGATNVLTTGNLTNTVSGKIEILSQDSTLDTGNVIWPSPISTTGGGAATNIGAAIGADGQGFAYVAGNFGSAANGKDSVLLRYNLSDGTGLTTLYQNGVTSGSLNFTGANEFLGAAVDTDGTTYIVGYITQTNLVSTTAAGAVTSWWIGKFSSTGLVPVWTATFNNGVGSDQGISLSLSGNFVYVVGSQTVTGPKTGLRVFKFVK